MLVPLRNRAIAKLTRRHVITGLPRWRRHHRRDLRRDMVLHEHEASPESQPRTRRTGFTPELLSHALSLV